ncbi:hypothetical protein [Streptomyces graminilatus]|uniref:hypothetical protein n=1 Tax=Streptomyces graminilatus TaxID=1464070 RepID=UPI0006E2FB73|nr:hypothetical protein [Streptomyces graminilatus]
MSRSLRKKFAGALAVAAMVGGSLTLATGEASAWSAPRCNSPALTGCVQINNWTHNVHSFRLEVIEPNGHSWNRCLNGTNPGSTSFYPGVWFANHDAVFTTGYWGNNCEGWSKVNDLHPSWQQPDAYQYWYLNASQG